MVIGIFAFVFYKRTKQHGHQKNATAAVFGDLLGSLDNRRASKQEANIIVFVVEIYLESWNLSTMQNNREAFKQAFNTERFGDAPLCISSSMKRSG